MRFKLLGAMGALSIIVSAPLAAQTAPAPSASSQTAGPAQAKSTARNTTQGAARTQREPTAGQMAARERQKKCGAEWKEAKAANRVSTGQKWPQFWSACNKPLKGGTA